MALLVGLLDRHAVFLFSFLQLCDLCKKISVLKGTVKNAICLGLLII